MKSKILISSVAIVAIVFFNSCKKEVHSENSGISNYSANNFQTKVTTDYEYSMMKLLLNYGTVTPYKKLIGNEYIKEQSPSNLNKEGC